MLTTTPDINWNTIRANYALAPQLSYFQNDTFSPPALEVLDHLEQWQHQIAANPAFPMRFSELNQSRIDIASFFGASADEITITRSATEGLHIVLQGIQWRPGDELISLIGESSRLNNTLKNLQHRYGVTLINADIDWLTADDDSILKALSALATHSTRLIILPHVKAEVARILPVRSISEWARQRKVLTLVDASHSVGAQAVNFHDLQADYIAADGHTWLGGGLGTGIAFFRTDAQQYVWQTTGGFFDPLNSDPDQHSARRFERNAGQKNIPSLLSIAFSLDYQARLGRESIYRRISQLTQYFEERIQEHRKIKLTQPHENRATNFVTLKTLERDAKNIQTLLFSEYGIKVGTTQYNGHHLLTFAPHIHNNETQIHHLVDALRALL